MKKFDVAIIGAGSVGLPLSFYLADRGLKVAVFEKMQSEGRGQNRAAIGGIRATHSDPAKIKICKMSIEIVSRMEKEYGIDIDWIDGGYLYPIYDEKNETALKELLKFQKKFDLNIDWITPDDIEKLTPGISRENLRGGTYSPDDGSASPLKLADAFYMLARNSGAEFHFNEEVTAMILQNGRITQLITNKNRYAADIIINAAGANARDIGKMAGLDIPVYPDSHEAGITEPVKRFFEPMIVDIRPDKQSANYYFYQDKEGQVVFCITPEPKIPGSDIDNTSEFLPLVIKRMVKLYPRLRNLRVRRTWRGLYPMTPDGFPIVGYTKEVKNFILAVGMCGQGFMIGPGLGKILSEIIIDKTDKYDDILEQLTLYRSFTGEEILK
ncbi:MAG: sulfurtransferase [Candidatus Neomarinimicrobiota bacterium]|nr:MAG: sulfurtransferase [Candidatus Neomarinimicrobiota bacterium]